jgi:hypothetical protein
MEIQCLPASLNIASILRRVLDSTACNLCLNGGRSLQWSNRAVFKPLDEESEDWREQYKALDPVSVSRGMVTQKTRHGIVYDVVKARCDPCYGLSCPLREAGCTDPCYVLRWFHVGDLLK